MAPPIRATLLAVLALAPMAAACGGKVAVDAPSGQGGQALTACAMFCDARAIAGCPFPHQDECAAGCAIEVGYEGKCAATAVAVLECSANLPADVLCAGKGCDEEQAVRRACDHPPGGCSENQCVGDANKEMDCSTTCGDNVYETTCLRSGEIWACTCILNGSTVGACTDVTVPWADCCDGIFVSQ